MKLRRCIADLQELNLEQRCPLSPKAECLRPSAANQLEGFVPAVNDDDLEGGFAGLELETELLLDRGKDGEVGVLGVAEPVLGSGLRA